jgi:acetyl esterase
VGAEKSMDAELRRYLDAIRTDGSAPQTVEEMVRARRVLMIQALKSRGEIPGLANGVEARDVAMSGGLKGRVYRPQDSEVALPLIVYLHGGGWAAGSVETHDPFCRLLSGESGVMILSVEYRLAPEHPFPAAFQDTVTAFRWAAENAQKLGADTQWLALGGDSAGGNLATVAATRICAANDAVRPAALVLLYPVMDHPSAGHASYRQRGTGCGLEASLMEWFWGLYARDVSPDEAEISPLRAKKLPPLPPTLVATAEYDPLRDEGIAYAEKLKSAGVKVTHMHSRDMHHNFPVHPGTVMRFPQSVTALKEIAAWVKNSLHSEE